MEMESITPKVKFDMKTLKKYSPFIIGGVVLGLVALYFKSKATTTSTTADNIATSPSTFTYPQSSDQMYYGSGVDSSGSYYDNPISNAPPTVINNYYNLPAVSPTGAPAVSPTVSPALATTIMERVVNPISTQVTNVLPSSSSPYVLPTPPKQAEIFATPSMYSATSDSNIYPDKTPATLQAQQSYNELKINNTPVTNVKTWENIVQGIKDGAIKNPNTIADTVHATVIAITPATAPIPEVHLATPNNPIDNVIPIAGKGHFGGNAE